MNEKYDELCERALVNINAMLSRTFRTGFYYDIRYSPLGTSLLKRYEEEHTPEIVIHKVSSQELFMYVSFMQDTITDIENRMNHKSF